MVRNQLIRGALQYYVDHHVSPMIGRFEDQLTEFRRQRLDTETTEKSLKALYTVRDDYWKLLKEFE